MSKMKWLQLRFLGGILAALSVLLAVACGAAAEPTPTAVAIPTPTQAAPVPTATPTRVAPGPVATPTATSTPTPKPSPTAEAVTTKVKRGGVLRDSTASDPSSFDPHLASIAADIPANGNVYSYLLLNTKDYELVCDLCTTWSLDDGGKTMVFNLVKNAFFEDGSPLTSKDVVYSLKKMIGQVDGVISPRCGILKEYIANVKEPFEAADAYTVKIHLTNPSQAVAPSLAMLYCAILKDGTTRAAVQTKPNGSGPFRIGKWDKGSSFQLVPTPNYWKKDANGVTLPYLNGLEIKIILDPTARLAAALTGRVDRGSASGLGPDQWKLFQDFVNKGNGTWRATSISKLMGGAIMNVTKPPFDNKKLRLAVNLALDRRSGTEILYNGRAAPALYQSSDWPWARTPEEIWDKVPGWGTGAKKQQEIEQAKQLMKEAGYPNGLSVIQNGANWEDYHILLNEWMSPQLGRIGVNTQIKLLDRGPFTPKMASLDYALTAYIFGYAQSDPDEFLGAYFITGAARNWTGFSDRRIDDLYVKQKAEGDPQKRNILVRQAEDILLEEMPIAPMPARGSDSILWWYWKGSYDTSIGYTAGRYEFSYDGRVQ